MIHVTEHKFHRGDYEVIRRKTVWLFWFIPIYIRDYSC